MTLIIESLIKLVFLNSLMSNFCQRQLFTTILKDIYLQHETYTYHKTISTSHSFSDLVSKIKILILFYRFILYIYRFLFYSSLNLYFKMPQCSQICEPGNKMFNDLNWPMEGMYLRNIGSPCGFQ